MNTKLVYDIPLRLFHWLFAGLFVSAFFIAKIIGDDSPVFSYHMLAGIMLGFIVGLRILWGFVGSRYSRFASFALNPRDLLNYFSGILSGKSLKWTGHNPASSWASLFMFLFALLLGVTGFLMTTGQKETFEDIHELLANGFLVIVLLHIAGIVLHSLRYQDKLAFSMVEGKKTHVEPGQEVTKAHGAAGVLFLLFVLSFGLYLGNHFDSKNQSLNLFGAHLMLGENEAEEHEAGKGYENGESKGDYKNKHDEDVEKDDD